MAKQDHQFMFKPLIESDLQLLCEWLNQPHLQEWWPDPPGSGVLGIDRFLADGPALLMVLKRESMQKATNSKPIVKENQDF